MTRDDFLYRNGKYKNFLERLKRGEEFVIQEVIKAKNEYRIFSFQDAAFGAIHRDVPEFLHNALDKVFGKKQETGYAFLGVMNPFKRKALNDFMESFLRSNPYLKKQFEAGNPVHLAWDVIEGVDGKFYILEPQLQHGTVINSVQDLGLIVTGKRKRSTSVLTGAVVGGAAAGASAAVIDEKINADEENKLLPEKVRNIFKNKESDENEHQDENQN